MLWCCLNKYFLNYLDLLNGPHQIVMPGNYLLKLKRKDHRVAGSTKLIMQATAGNKDILIVSANEDIRF